MPQPAGQQYEYHYYSRQNYNRPQLRAVKPMRTADKKKIERNYLIHKIVSVVLVSLIAFTILPIGFNKISTRIFNPTPYKKITTDYQQIVFPTTNYLSNHWFMGMRSLANVAKKPQMTTPVENSELSSLKNEVKYIASTYPEIKPSVYVWDYQTGDYVNFNADETYPTASIIKLPVLVELFRSIEKGQMTLNEKMSLTDYYITEGSGSLQYKGLNSQYTIDNLARVMITESDNSATNMLMARLGSMTDVNSAIRQWGLKHTYVQTWLPDLEGTNHSTARDMATILYNIDNPNFLSNESREKIFDYMGHVHNNRLIAAGLPQGTEFLHKTGDIGKMLGDAGIVFAPNGKKYIVVMFVNRPHNSPLGKEFIVKASETIYNYMVK